MKEHLRNNYFLVLKMLVVLALEMYIIFKYDVPSGVSVMVLLLSAFFLAAVTGCELAVGKIKFLFLTFEAVLVLFLTIACTKLFSLLFAIVILDVVSVNYFNLNWYWYLSSYLLLLFTEQNDKLIQLLLVTFLVVIYIQYGVIIRSYQAQLKENEQIEQKLKKNINKKEIFFYEEKIIVLNQLIRCTISDNGVGCEEIIDGMGLSGMRKRVRSVNGILDFESEAGFIINMLLPLV